MAQIISRLLAHYPGADKRADSVAEDWVRVLRDQPLASIWACYERYLRKPGEFAPAVGTFYAAVERHAMMTERVCLSLQAKEG